MARIALLLLALLLAAPALLGGCRLVAATLFLAEFLSGGGWPLLTAVTRPPVVRALPAAAGGRPVPVDLFIPRRLARPPGLVLVHGLAPAGKDDERLREAAALLARAGWAVAVPTVAGLTRLRLRPDDAEAVLLLGCAQQELDDLVGARESYRAYLELQPAGGVADEVRSVLKAL